MTLLRLQLKFSVCNWFIQTFVEASSLRRAAIRKKRQSLLHSGVWAMSLSKKILPMTLLRLHSPHAIGLSTLLFKQRLFDELLGRETTDDVLSSAC